MGKIRLGSGPTKINEDVFEVLPKREEERLIIYRDVPVEVKVEVEKPVEVIKEVIKVVEKPVEIIKIKEVAKIVEKPIYIEKIVEKPVEVKIEVEKVITIPKIKFVKVLPIWAKIVIVVEALLLLMSLFLGGK